MISSAVITECLLNARQVPEFHQEQNRQRPLLSLDSKSSWERQTIGVVKININVAGGDKCYGGN